MQRFPASLAAWRSPGRRLPEPATAYPSLEISIDPGLKTPWAQQAAAGIDQALGKDFAVSANFIWVRGKEQVGTIDYNPVVPALGAGRRPERRQRRRRHLGLGPPVHLVRRDLVPRAGRVSLTKRFSNDYQFMVSYTLSKAEDNSTDFQSAFIPQNNGRGRNPSDRTGLAARLRPRLEKGPATHDQRHRLVVSGLYRFPWDIQLSTIITAASGRPYTALAGADLNGDGDGGEANSSGRANSLRRSERGFSRASAAQRTRYHDNGSFHDDRLPSPPSAPGRRRRP